MTRPRFTIRGLMIAVAIVGFDIAVMVAAIARAGPTARAGHAGIEVVYGFGLILSFLHFVGFGLYRSFARTADLPATTRLNSTPSPLLIFGLYAAMISLAILSVLFLTSGRF